MATATVPSQQHEAKQQQEPPQQPHQQPHPQLQPAVQKVQSLLYRRVKVLLPSGRVIEGDLACLDKQGNLILSNAQEHIHAGSSESSGGIAGAGGSSGSGSGAKPQTMQLGMVLVPKAQQQEVLLRVTLSEKAAMLSLANGS